MNKFTFSTYAKDNGGRVSILFLLFLLAIYELITAGLPSFAIICLLPILFLLAITTFQYRMFNFWVLIFFNYFIQMKDFPSLGIPMSLYNEMLEIILLAIAFIDARDTKFERAGNLMLFALIVWCGYCTLEILNDTCGIGINIGAWFTGIRMMAFQLLYAFLVFSFYINNPKRLTHYLFFWGALAFFASFWVFKQQYIGLTHTEESWLFYGAGRRTHVIQGGTLIRYFSIFSDAANFGIGIASTAVAFIIFGITSKIKKHRIFFLIIGSTCAWAMFPSGTRTAIACLMAGFMAYIFLSKSFKIAIPFTIVFTLFVFVLAFTSIGQGNQQIRRMRSAFNKEDASANQRTLNQEVMKKYMKEAPWGIGIGLNRGDVPANNKYALMSVIPPDSEYIYIWIRTGIIGITVFLICTAIMIIGACRIVLFRLKSPSLRGIGAGLTCAMISQQLGGYGNQVLMQFPNCLTFYGGLAIVYILPFIENEWIAYEEEQLAIEAEKKRLKEEKKKAKRV